MFIQAIQFIFSLISQLFQLVFSIRLSDNLTFGGIIIGMILTSILLSLIITLSGLSEFRTEHVKSLRINSNKKIKKKGKK